MTFSDPDITCSNADPYKLVLKLTIADNCARQLPIECEVSTHLEFFHNLTFPYLVISDTMSDMVLFLDKSCSLYDDCNPPHVPRGSDSSRVAGGVIGGLIFGTILGVVATLGSLYLFKYVRRWFDTIEDISPHPTTSNNPRNDQPTTLSEQDDYEDMDGEQSQQCDYELDDLNNNVAYHANSTHEALDHNSGYEQRSKTHTYPKGQQKPKVVHYKPGSFQRQHRSQLNKKKDDQ